MRPPAAASARRRLLVVSHPAVTSVNQIVYRELAQRGWEVTLVLPRRWRHAYSPAPVRPRALEGLEGALRPTPVAFAGAPQRHLYLTRCRSVCAAARPDVAFLEAEPYALAATQWRLALTRLGIPFGVQCYENLDRALPPPVRGLRARVLRDAAFVAARSDTAGRLARSWGARGEVALAPPAVPEWEAPPSCAQEHATLNGAHPPGSPAGPAPRNGDGPAPAPPGAEGGRAFTVGYAGRLVASKGLADLLAAVRELDAPVELVLIGDGELRGQLEGQPIPGSRVRVLNGLSHAQMAQGYAQLDVLALPSRTTPTWKEQFGRVLVEALSCGVPVIGSDSGEIPWLIELTGGGLTFPEGDTRALADALRRLRAEPELRRRLAARGGEAVARLFSVPAATDQLERLLLGATDSRERAPQ